MDRSADASTMAPAGSANGGSLTEQAKQQAGQAVEKTKQAASRLTDQAVQQARTGIETGKERASSNVDHLAQALMATGETLREHQQPAMGEYAEKGAEMLDQVARYFRDHSVEEITGDVERFARRQPGLFLCGAFTVGFLLGRFLKSSSPNGAGDRYPAATTGGYRQATVALAPTREPAEGTIATGSAGAIGSSGPAIAP